MQMILRTDLSEPPYRLRGQKYNDGDYVKPGKKPLAKQLNTHGHLRLGSPGELFPNPS